MVPRRCPAGGRLINSGFGGVDVFGRELSKDDVLERMASVGNLVELAHDDIRARRFDDCTVVTAVSVVGVEIDGEIVTKRFPYMRVWFKRDRGWVAVATQSSGIPAR